jgi:hypothetical protein
MKRYAFMTLFIGRLMLMASARSRWVVVSGLSPQTSAVPELVPCRVDIAATI